MTRLDRGRLDGGVYPYHCQVAMRFADLDQLGHANNVAVAAILQEARLRFIQAFDLIGVVRCELVVAASLIEFAHEMLYPDPIQVAIGVLDIGRTSFRLGQVARQNDRVGAYAEVVQVSRNGQGPVPLPDEWRGKLERMKMT
jgi:acyl-CoA thioester hydrolase